jgi:hypothetical protein
MIILLTLSVMKKNDVASTTTIFYLPLPSTLLLSSSTLPLSVCPSIWMDM